MEKTILFIRQEGITIETIALLKVTLDKDIPDTKVIDEFKRLVSMWVRDTKAGKDCWNYSGGDLNIGDLASYDKQFSKFLTSLNKKNHGHILNMSIEFCGSTGSIPFDTILAHKEE